jgi:hypothetical protein
MKSKLMNTTITIRNKKVKKGLDKKSEQSLNKTISLRDYQSVCLIYSSIVGKFFNVG